MNNTFKTIGIIGTHHNPLVATSVSQILKLLHQHHYFIQIESETAENIKNTEFKVADIHQIGRDCDLVIVVGGDGNFLSAARVMVEYDTPLVGINRGKLGFLTDIKPDELENKLLAILKGQYQCESRFLISAQLITQTNKSEDILALNEIVISSGTFSKMLAFDVRINNEFVYSQLSDGLIIATPTGSTAYALSGGGPILHPSLNVFTLVPMFPHTLTNRPIVIHADHTITITIAKRGNVHPILSHDGLTHCNIQPGDQIAIKKHHKPLNMIHPEDYSYYNTLRTKLHWGKQLVAEEHI